MKCSGSRTIWAGTDTPLPHGLSYDSRLTVYNWFERHLKGASSKDHGRTFGGTRAGSDTVGFAERQRDYFVRQPDAMESGEVPSCSEEIGIAGHSPKA